MNKNKVTPVPTTENTATSKFQQQGKVRAANGSILMPENAGLAFVLNVANLAGKTDGELYSTFDRKWAKVKQEVRGWYATKTGTYKFGATNVIAVQSNVWVISLLCQDEKSVTDIKALETCLKETCKLAKLEHATIHVSPVLTKSIPELEQLCNKYFVEQGVNVYLYGA